MLGVRLHLEGLRDRNSRRNLTPVDHSTIRLSIEDLPLLSFGDLEIQHPQQPHEACALRDVAVPKDRFIIRVSHGINCVGGFGAAVSPLVPRAAASMSRRRAARSELQASG